MNRTIRQIREEMQAATLEGLPAFIKVYEVDERAGVRALVERARKKMDAYEEELKRLEEMRQIGRAHV